MKNLLKIKTENLIKKSNELELIVCEKIKHQKKKCSKLYNLTECHIYQEVLDHYCIHLNLLSNYVKDTSIKENYEDYKDNIKDLGRLYMTLSWFEQFLSKYRKVFIEPKFSGLSQGIKFAITSILYPYSLNTNKVNKGINLTIKDVKKYFKSIMSVANTTVPNLGLAFYIERNYILDIGSQRSKYILPEYGIEETIFDLKWNVEKTLEKIFLLGNDISKERMYDSFICEYEPNTGMFSTNSEIIAFELSKNVSRNHYGDEFYRSFYSNKLHDFLLLDLDYELYALDLLCFFLNTTYGRYDWEINRKELGIDSAREQFCFNILNLLDTTSILNILKEDESKYNRHKLTSLKETGYNVNEYNINTDLLIVIKLYLQNFKNEASDKLEKTLRSLYNVLAARNEDFYNAIL